MANFKVRVVLHGVSDHAAAIYQQLHQAMEAHGFERTVSGDDNEPVHLPPATYHYSGSLSRRQVRDLAQAAAETTGYVLWTRSVPATAKSFGVLVTEGNSTWIGLKPV